jgi:glutamate-1-semialdehyde aminotransferase
MLEPTGAIAPQAGFLEEVAALTRSHGAVLVFDEIVTGFRTDMGGAQARYGVVPDLACFGKGMANGMPLAALTGSRHLMEMMADVFVSGTFGGETLSLAASIATLRKLKRTDAVRRMHDTGAKLKAEAQRIIERHDLQATLSMIGDDWRPVLSVMEAQAGSTLVMSLVRQETAQAGLLFGSGFTLCLEHTDNVIVEQTLVRWDVALGAIARALALNNPHEALRGRAVQNAFAVRKST